MTAPAEAPAIVAAPGVERSNEKPGERPDDRGDRRGRRSRRRRNRGRGFPDSKYAPEPGPEAAAAESEAEEPEAAEEITATVSPIILPGESLAKYRAPVARTPPPSVEPEAVKASEPEAALVEEEVAEFDEPIHYLAENALPDAPVHAVETVAGEPEAIELEVAEIEAPEPSAEAGVLVEDVVEEEELIVAEESESGPAVAPMLDEEEDRDIQEMILEHAEGLEEAIDGLEPGASTVESDAAADAGNSGNTDSGTAAVRERGGRYPHRISRRMRRRGRGGHSQPEGPGEAATRRNSGRSKTRHQTRSQAVRPGGSSQ